MEDPTGESLPLKSLTEGIRYPSENTHISPIKEKRQRQTSDEDELLRYKIVLQSCILKHNFEMIHWMKTGLKVNSEDKRR